MLDIGVATRGAASATDVRRPERSLCGLHRADALNMLKMPTVVTGAGSEL